VQPWHLPLRSRDIQDTRDGPTCRWQNWADFRLAFGRSAQEIRHHDEPRHRARTWPYHHHRRMPTAGCGAEWMFAVLTQQLRRLSSRGSRDRRVTLNGPVGKVGDVRRGLVRSRSENNAADIAGNATEFVGGAPSERWHNRDVTIGAKGLRLRGSGMVNMMTATRTYSPATHSRNRSSGGPESDCRRTHDKWCLLQTRKKKKIKTPPCFFLVTLFGDVE